MTERIIRSWALPTDVSAPGPGSCLPFTDWQSAELVALLSGEGRSQPRADADLAYTNWQAAELVTFLGHRPRHSGIAVVVPARDEAEGLRDALSSLTGQLVRPDRVIVVVNNPTDGGATESIARGYAARHPDVVTVLVMPGHNRFKKAGALNYGVTHLLNSKHRLPTAVRLLVTMDGDTVLHRHFLARASRVMTGDSRLGGVSAACLAKPVRSVTALARLLILFQRIEYGRASFSRVLANVHSMSGAGSVYRASAVNDLLGSRPHLFDERETNLVEDYEATLALKARGWRVTANQGLIAYTDLMHTVGELVRQRERWARGTLDEWRRYGWLHRVCRRSVASTALTLAGFGYLWFRVVMTALAVAGGAGISHRSLYFTAGLWMAYQAATVWRMGWRVIVFEIALLPEIAYAVLRAYWTVRAIAASFRGGATAWAR